MVHVILYIATSVDGYIARPDGAVDWLSVSEQAGEDYGYAEFYDSVDALIMGRNTYEFCTAVEEWPYPGKPSFVFTGRSLPTQRSDVAVLTGDVRQGLRAIADQGYRTLWLVGGGQLIQAFCQHNLIDEFMIFQIPILIGTGISLFQEFPHDIPLKLISTTSYPSGVVRMNYEIQ